jgi:hypothetical protein
MGNVLGTMAHFGNATNILKFGLKMLLYICGLENYTWGITGLLTNLRRSKTTLGAIYTLAWRSVLIWFRVLNALFVPSIAIRHITVAVVLQIAYEVARVWLRAGRWLSSKVLARDGKINVLKQVRLIFGDE